MSLVKICGITRLEDAIAACEYGADLLGFVFAEKSPRYVTGVKARKMISAFRDRNRHFKGITGLFVDEKLETVIDQVLFCGLDLVQLHGSETPEFCSELKKALEEEHNKTVSLLKTFKVAEDILPAGPYITDDYVDADYLLFDTFRRGMPGGTGMAFNWKVIAKNIKKIRKPFFVAGGLNSANVADAVKTLGPFGVDTSSGVESSPGVKDIKLLKEFIKNAKRS